MPEASNNSRPGFVYHAGGYLDMNITKAGLREIVPYIELDTEFLGIVFPEVISCTFP